MILYEGTVVQNFSKMSETVKKVFYFSWKFEKFMIFPDFPDFVDFLKVFWGISLGFTYFLEKFPIFCSDFLSTARINDDFRGIDGPVVAENIWGAH